MKKKHFVVSHGTYPFDVLVCIGLKQKKVVKVLGKKLHRRLSESESESLWMKGTGRTIFFEGGQTIIRIDAMRRQSDFIPTLAHEVFHAVEFLFDRVGVKHSLDSGEVFAYQIQHVMTQILKRM